jgi:hypothetical protein
MGKSLNRVSLLRGLMLVAGAVMLMGLAPSSSKAESAQDAGYGPGGWVRAVMYSASFGSSNAYETGSMRLIITRGGERRVDTFPSPACEYCGLFAHYSKPVEVIQLNRSKEPEIIFSIYLGGAHCCSYSLIFQYRNGRYRATRHFWGNGFYRLRNLYGMRVFVARDDRFAYRFDCYACSRYPLAVWNLTGRGMVDVTRRFPSLIRRDANRHRRVWRVRARSGNAAAPLAAWLADQCMLKRCRPGWRTVNRVTRPGGVSAYYGGRERYIRKLRRTLRRFDYAG